MAVTTTPLISWLPERLVHYLPGVTFIRGENFSWNPETNSVEYRTDGTASALLHEFGHALLKHHTYSRDIELIGMERDAWLVARRIALELDIELDEDDIEDHLDTYREWLHARSSCTHCSETGLETAKHIYQCLSCGARWRVNDARNCQLRRYTEKKD